MPNSPALDWVTPWFPPDVAPARVGLYEIQAEIMAKWCYWNGKHWGFRCWDKKGAYDNRGMEALGPILAWRGLARKP